VFWFRVVDSSELIRAIRNTHTKKPLLIRVGVSLFGKIGDVGQHLLQELEIEWEYVSPCFNFNLKYGDINVDRKEKFI
jgi:hypothetical protein